MKQKTNTQLIEDFIQHLKDGKPVLRRKQKPISKSTESKLRSYLPRIDKWLNKSFYDVTVDDITEFRRKLKSDKIKGMKGQPFATSVKRDIEYKIMGKFFKWLNKPELIYFTDDYKEPIETSALSREEVEKIIAQCKLRDKVIWTLFYDGGMRADEFLNLTWNDLKDDERKAKGYYKLRIRVSKTKPRTIGLYLDFSTEIIDRWVEINKDKVGTSKPLVKICYDNMRKVIIRTAEQAINKKCWPHLIRHSSATYYAHKQNKFQLSYRYGWAMSSRMPDVYIDREGINEAETASNLMEEQAGKYRKEVNLLKENMRLMEDKHTAEMQQLRQMIIQKAKNEILQKKGLQ